jgi:hypothetical protein
MSARLRSSRRGRARASSAGFERALRNVASTLSPSKKKASKRGGGNNVRVGYTGLDEREASRIVSMASDDPLEWLCNSQALYLYSFLHQAKIVEGLNGTVVTDLAQYGDLTHIVANKLLRRSKSMAALSAGAIFVKPKWLEQSKKSGVFLQCDDFAVADDPKDAEKYGTTLRSSLENAKLAREHGGVLANKAVFVCQGVVGKKGGPTLGETKLLIKFAGGTFAKSQAQALSLLGPSKLLIIAEKGGALPNKLANAEAEGATRINLHDFFFRYSTSSES